LTSEFVTFHGSFQHGGGVVITVGVASGIDYTEPFLGSGDGAVSLAGQPWLMNCAANGMAIKNPAIAFPVHSTSQSDGWFAKNSTPRNDSG